MYTYHPYPKWVHHKEHGSIVVNDQSAHEALGPGWHHDKATALAMPELAIDQPDSTAEPLSTDDAIDPEEITDEEEPEEETQDEISGKIEAARKRGRPKKV